MKEKNERVMQTERRLREHRQILERIALMQTRQEKLCAAQAALRNAGADAETVEKLETEIRRNAVSLQLRRLEAASVEAAMGRLTGEERRVLERMLLDPTPYAADALCEELCVETATVYRRRKAALEKLSRYLSDEVQP